MTKHATSRRLLFAGALAALVSVTVSPATLAATKKAPAKKKASATTAPTTPTTAAPTTAAPAPETAKKATIKIGSIPDQDPARIQRGFGIVAKYIEAKTGLKTEFVPVADYASAVTAFRVGDLDLVWFGGLTGVQAHKQVKDAIYIAQRDIDARFRSVFIAGKDVRIPTIDSAEKLAFVKGYSFTFGSESSTSGRTMPQYFLDLAGLDLQDFRGAPGFSGSHDRTIRLVESGSYEVGVLNKSTWDANVANKTVDLDKVKVIYTTPTYYDYHWLARPNFDEKFGAGSAVKVKQMFLSLNREQPDAKEVLDFFGATSFIETKNSNYVQIEKVGKRLGLL